MSMANLSKLILTATGILLSMLLVSCSIQKRTLRPGFHVERIGALNKKPSRQVQAQETANLPVLPNESVGLSHTPLASEALAQDTENLDKLEDLAAVTPPQSIESGSLKRELSPERSDSTGTSVIEGQFATSSDEELLAKIAKAERVQRIFLGLMIAFGWIEGVVWVPFWYLVTWKRSQINTLRKEAKLPYRLAWYNTELFRLTYIPFFGWLMLPFVLPCRLIDQHRLKMGREPLSWKAKTIFFSVLVFGGGYLILAISYGPLW
jgi:hypothetical protein